MKYIKSKSDKEEVMRVDSVQIFCIISRNSVCKIVNLQLFPEMMYMASKRI